MMGFIARVNTSLTPCLGSALTGRRRVGTFAINLVVGDCPDVGTEMLDVGGHRNLVKVTTFSTLGITSDKEMVCPRRSSLVGRSLASSGESVRWCF